MWIIVLLLVIGVLYVGAGFLVTFVNAQSRDDKFKVDWNKILTWPKLVFGG